MKIVKYILFILLIIGGFGFIGKRDFITGLFTLILGGIILPPLSDKIKKQILLFQNKRIRYGIYIGLFLLAGAFMPKSDAKKFGSKEDVPRIESSVDEVLIENQKGQTTKKEKIANENRKFNKIMGNDDFWNKYDPLVKRRIFELIVSKDCKELQNEYNVAADLMEKKQNSGIGASKELELISFLDDKMRDLDCY